MLERLDLKSASGAGTGLGQCFLTRDGNDYVCYPSEGGHVEYNPRSDLEIELRSSLMENFQSPRRVLWNALPQAVASSMFTNFRCRDSLKGWTQLFTRHS
jgi:hypothetical protein